MGGISNELFDFLTDLAEVDGKKLKFPEKSDALSILFFRYLHSVGVEHCNFGLFGLDQTGAALNELSGSRLPPGFVEEFVNELSKDAYVLLRAETLCDHSPVQQFDVGLDYLAEHEALSERAPLVQIETARHGMIDGRALIGKSKGHGDTSRFFGFAFAGDRASGRQIRLIFNDLQVAAYALMDRMMAKLEADQDGFRYTLTRRERDVLGAVDNGLKRDAIAFEMNIAKPTVDLHLAGLRRKLDAQTQAEAVAKGFRYGIL